MENRVCTSCGETKPLEEFKVCGNHKGTVYRRHVCKKCMNIQYADKNREIHAAEYERRRNDPEYREQAKLRANAWYYANRERALAKMKEVVVRDPDKVRKRKADWKERNREHVQAKGREDYRRNKDRYYAHRHTRLSRTKGAEGSFTRDELKQLSEKQQGICALCSMPMNGKESIDHILPLSRGGTNYISNIQLTHARCNKSKGTRTNEEYFAGTRYDLNSQVTVSSLDKAA